MNNKGGLVYFTPNYLVESKNFFKNIKIGIKSRGYNMKQGENNLLIYVGVLNRFSQNSKTNYKQEEYQMIKILGSKEIKAILAKKFSTEIYAKSEWKIKTIIEGNILVLEENMMNKNSNSNLNIRFGSYRYEARCGSSKQDDNDLEET